VIEAAPHDEARALARKELRSGAAPTDGIRRSTKRVDNKRGDEVEAAPPTKKGPVSGRAGSSVGEVSEAAVDRDGSEAVEAVPPRKKAAEATGRR
jgi:hypothetical protein